MKRTCPLILALLFATAAFAAETQRYLVATKHAAIHADVRQMLGEDFAARDVVPFATFSGFAADLTESEVASLRRANEVRWVEPVLERHAFAQERDPLRQTVPFGVSAVLARQAQLGFVKGTINVVVADTGVDYRHPELQGIWAGGRNVLADTDDPLDDDWHGTHVAGTVAAADNDIGVVGVAPKVRLWGIKVLNGHGSGDTAGVIKALDWISAKKTELGGNWVVNLSLGAYTESAGEREAFQRIRDQGILAIAASGNLSTSTTPAPVAFPAAYPSVIGVGATTFDGQLAEFSGQGPELDLAAPGVDVLSLLPVGTNEISYVADGNTATYVDELIGSKRDVVSGEFVYCGFGRPGDFPPSAAGKIALIKRGEQVSFADKTRRAKEAGATAVAIFDNVEIPTPGAWNLLNNDEDRAYDWPVAVRLSMQTGEALLAKGPHRITVAFTNDDYFVSSGTSMACPHVVGAAALVWSLAPDATVEQVINALTVSAKDLGPAGHDSMFGAGMIDVYAAAKLLAPHAFGNITTGRPVGLRGRK
jgi:subtilisin family serine protease